jgi:hypothetical protein
MTPPDPIFRDTSALSDEASVASNHGVPFRFPAARGKLPAIAVCRASSEPRTYVGSENDESNLFERIGVVQNSTKHSSPTPTSPPRRTTQLVELALSQSALVNRAGSDSELDRFAIDGLPPVLARHCLKQAVGHHPLMLGILESDRQLRSVSETAITHIQNGALNIDHASASSLSPQSSRPTKRHHISEPSRQTKPTAPLILKQTREQMLLTSPTKHLSELQVVGSMRDRHDTLDIPIARHLSNQDLDTSSGTPAVEAVSQLQLPLDVSTANQGTYQIESSLSPAKLNPDNTDDFELTSTLVRAQFSTQVHAAPSSFVRPRGKHVPSNQQNISDEFLAHLDLARSQLSQVSLHELHDTAHLTQEEALLDANLELDLDQAQHWIQNQMNRFHSDRENRTGGAQSSWNAWKMHAALNKPKQALLQATTSPNKDKLEALNQIFTATKAQIANSSSGISNAAISHVDTVQRLKTSDVRKGFHPESKPVDDIFDADSAQIIGSEKLLVHRQPAVGAALNIAKREYSPIPPIKASPLAEVIITQLYSSFPYSTHSFDIDVWASIGSFATRYQPEGRVQYTLTAPS